MSVHSSHSPGFIVVFRLEENIFKEDEFPWQPRLVDAKHYEFVDFSQEQVMFILISTAGDGKAA